MVQNKQDKLKWKKGANEDGQTKMDRGGISN